MKRTLKHISYSMGNFANTIAYQVFGNRIQGKKDIPAILGIC